MIDPKAAKVYERCARALAELDDAARRWVLDGLLGGVLSDARAYAQPMPEHMPEHDAQRRSEHARAAARARWASERTSLSVSPSSVNKSKDINTEGNTEGEGARAGTCAGASKTDARPMLDACSTDAQPASKRSKRGTRIDAQWMPKPDHFRIGASINLSTERIEAEAQKFRDYWLAESGAKASKLDWDRAFNNWLRRAQEYGPRGAPRPSNVQPVHGQREWKPAAEF